MGLQITDWDSSSMELSILAGSYLFDLACTSNARLKDQTGGAPVRPSGERMSMCRGKAKYSRALSVSENIPLRVVII